MKSRAIFVLGMHRCGTSALTRCLGLLGAELGSELIAPAGDNPTGFWEDARFLSINQRLTALLGEEGDRWAEHSAPLEVPLGSPAVRALIAEAVGEIERRFAFSVWWAVKDPRTLRALPFWEEVVSQAGVRLEPVVAVRHPLACAQSLARRNELSESRSLLLWLSQYLAHWPRIAARPFVAVDYDRLLEEPERELRRLGQRLGLPWRKGAAEEARGFLRPDLRHARFAPGELRNRPDAAPLVVETFEALEDLCADRDPEAAAARLSALHAEFCRAVPLLRALDSEAYRAERREEELRAEWEGAWKRQIEELRRELERTGETLGAREAELGELRSLLPARERELGEWRRLAAAREGELSAMREERMRSRSWRWMERSRAWERAFRSWRKRLRGPER